MKLKAITVLLMFGLLIGCSNEEVTQIENEEYEEVNDQVEPAITFKEQVEIVKGMEGKSRDIDSVDAIMIGSERIDMGNNKYQYIENGNISSLTIQMDEVEEVIEKVDYTLVDKDGNVTNSETES